MDRTWVGLAPWMLLLHPFSLRGGDTGTKGTEEQECREQGACRPGGWSHLLLRAQWKCHQRGALTCLQLVTMVALLVSLAPQPLALSHLPQVTRNTKPQAMSVEM